VRLVLGSEGSEHLALRVLRRSWPESGDYWDGNWLGCAVDVRVGGFRGHVDGIIRAEEFVAFRDGLCRLYEQLAGEAAFQTMEQWLSIRVVGDGRGHFDARCELLDDPGVGNRLAFALAFDQTSLPKMLRELDGIIDAFPVVGRP
jgi:hypothetical protein